MKVAIASQSSDEQYEIVALSEKIITYEEYCLGAVELLDTWDDGNPYFWYEARGYKDAYIRVQEDWENDWKVFYGYTQYYEMIQSIAIVLPIMPMRSSYMTLIPTNMLASRDSFVFGSL